MQLRVQLQEVHATQRWGKQVSSLPPAHMALPFTGQAYAPVFSSLMHMSSTFRLHHSCCAEGASALQP